MSQEIFAIAIMEAFEGHGDDLERLLLEFYAMLQRKGYSRDQLFRDAKRPNVFVHLRHWFSPEARQEAHEDPDVHRYWARIPEFCQMRTVFEKLEEVPAQSGNRVIG